MATSISPQLFCTQCGTEVDVRTEVCPTCSTDMKTRLDQPESEDRSKTKQHTYATSQTSQAAPDQSILDDNRTIRVAPRKSSRSLASEASDDDNATIRVVSRKTTEDADATMLATSRLSARLYAQAVENETAARAQTQSQIVQAEQGKKLFRRTNRSASAARPFSRKLLIQVSCVLALLLVLSLLVAGVVSRGSGDAHAQQQAAQDKAQIDHLISYAESIGVPASLLQPVIKQEQQLTMSSAPFGLFNSQAIVSYDRNRAKSYHQLLGQLPQILANATQQAQLQAQQDIQTSQTALSRMNMQGIGNLSYFSQQFSQNQLALSSAQYPKDYAAISKNARSIIDALNAMEVTNNQLTDFQHTIDRMKHARLDVTAMQNEYDNDVQNFNNATQTADFQNVSVQINAQYQQVVVNSIQAFPYVSVTKLNELQSQIGLLKTYGMNAQKYQQLLSNDQVAMQNATTIADDLLFFKRIDGDIASMQDDLVHGQSHYLVKQFHAEVTNWAKAHPYHDSHDNRTYALDNGYMQNGIGAALDGDLSGAATSRDLEAVIVEAQNAIFNLHMLEADYGDQTAYNQVHATDTQMLNHYRLQNRQVLMVSLVEQAMRVYQNGHLVQSYHVTTGRQELPSLPGVWAVLNRRSPIIFTSGEPKGSPYWFPDTPISYAILYHWGGYYVHDAPWRANFGPGTQFPHDDTSGTTAYNFDGSHGCINLQESDASWVYKHTDWNTAIVIY